MPTPKRSLIAMLVATWFVACKGQPPAPAQTAAHVPGTPHTDEVLGAWRSAGLAPEEFASVQPAPNSAAYCEHGKVHGVDTLVCEYASEADMAQGARQVREGWERVDAHTGVLLQTKRTMMVAVDRERREPSGKTIRQMAKAFEKLQ